MNLGLGGLCGLLVLTIMVLLFQDPVVVLINEDQRVFTKAKRQSVSIGEPEIVKVVEEFIKARYEWPSIEPKAIAKALEPVTTGGLNRKIKVLLGELKEKGLQGKKASQKVAGISVTVSEKEIVANFDKVLRVEGIPLIVPTGLMLNVVKGAQTKWNPSGVYINGVIESASK